MPAPTPLISTLTILHKLLDLSGQSVPNCVNRDAIQRLLAQAGPPFTGPSSAAYLALSDALGTLHQHSRGELHDTIWARFTDYVTAVSAEVAALQQFKAYVHGRLDDAGIDPHTEQNASNGCRIGARLDDVQARFTSQGGAGQPWHFLPELPDVEEGEQERLWVIINGRVYERHFLNNHLVTTDEGAVPFEGWHTCRQNPDEGYEKWYEPCFDKITAWRRQEPQPTAPDHPYQA